MSETLSSQSDPLNVDFVEINSHNNITLDSGDGDRLTVSTVKVRAVAKTSVCLLITWETS